MPTCGAGRRPLPEYHPAIEEAVAAIEPHLSDSYHLSGRAVALLLLQSDEEMEALVRSVEGERFAPIRAALDSARAALDREPESAVLMGRREAALQLLDGTVSAPAAFRVSLEERLSRICTSPVTGLPILVLVVWFGLYQFVGVFGGGTLVGLLEDGLFGTYINPWVVDTVERLIPWRWLSSLFVGEYGMWTLGVTYAAALVLPIVGTFFLAFSVLEDSGYFPRLAMLIDRLFKRIGLSGKAVIPIVLGFGCDTMATIVTRILETRRERVIATFLLSLAIPCSAQLGVMAAMLAGHAVAFWMWVGVMTAIFLLVGFLTARLLPGEAAPFAMELPPLRLPTFRNTLTKTAARMQWYLLEVFPLFLLASVLIWAGQLTGLLGLLVRGLEPVVGLMGLPPKAAEAFLFGFFRRDYGAAGLYRLQDAGGLTGIQLLVSVVALTLFLPCIAQFLMIRKERGGRMALAVLAFVFPFAVGTGALLNLLLQAFRIRL